MMQAKRGELRGREGMPGCHDARELAGVGATRVDAATIVHATRRKHETT